MSHVFAKKKTRGILRFRRHIARHKRSVRDCRARTHRRNSMQVFETFSEEETYALGKRTGETATPDTVYALSGDLGVGKTVFTKGVAAGLGITEPVTSPTFTIVQSYHGGRLPFFHFDVYRISDIDEMEEIGVMTIVSLAAGSLLSSGRNLLRNSCRKIRFISGSRKI